jgi:hypothetical protein
MTMAIEERIEHETPEWYDRIVAPLSVSSYIYYVSQRRKRCAKNTIGSRLMPSRRLLRLSGFGEEIETFPFRRMRS